MALDTSIPLGVNPIKFDSPMEAQAKAMSLKAQMQNATLKDQEIQQGQNAMAAQMQLSQLAAQPGSIDPKTGTFTAEAISKITDPMLRQKLTQERTATLQKAAEIDLETTDSVVKMNKLHSETLHEVYEHGINAYEDTLKATGDKTQAQKAYDEAVGGEYADIKKTGRGGFGKDTEFKIIPYTDAKAKYISHEDRTKEEAGNTTVSKEAARVEQLHQQLADLPPNSPQSASISREIHALEAHIAKVDAPARTNVTVQMPGATKAAFENDVHGEEFLKSAPPEWRELIKGAAEGRVNPNSAVSPRDKSRFNEMVTQYDPTFEGGRANARSKLYSSFTSGDDAKNIASINTAIGHIGTLGEAAAALKSGDIPALNSWVNKFNQERGKGEILDVNMARSAVGDEMMRTFRQAGASDKESEEWKDNFLSANSPQQWKHVETMAADLLNSRTNALQDKWTGEFGEDKPRKIVSDRSKAVLDKLGIKIDDGVSKTATPAVEAKPPKGVPANATIVGHTPDGKAVWGAGGKKWVDD